MHCSLHFDIHCCATVYCNTSLTVADELRDVVEKFFFRKLSVFQVKDFLSRFANIPDLLELDHLTVSGDVTFGRSVSLKVRSLTVIDRLCSCNDARDTLLFRVVCA